MIEKILKNAPDSWEVVELNEIGLINPKIEKSLYEDNKVCSFVPMSAVEAESGRIDVSETRLFSQVKKGFTPFFERDVLFAKITPCMENGKVAVVPKLIGDLGFGSTEFHVVRPYSYINESYIFYYLVSQVFRYEAERNMTGAVGQRRVPAPWLSSVKIPLPPQKEQQRIVEKVEELFSELDKGIESLKKAKQQLVVYRQALLKQAFEGKLTEQWREENVDKLQSPEDMLSMIKHEREARYQKQLEEWELNVANWESEGKKGKKPSKPRKGKAFSDVLPNNLSNLPKSWKWERLGNLIDGTPQNGIYKPASDYGKGTYIVRIDDFYDGQLIKKSDFKRLNLDDEELKKYQVEPNDVLVNRVNSIEYLGKCCSMPNDINESIVFESNIMKFKVLSGYLNEDYLTKFISSQMGKGLICSNAKHAVNQASINQTDVGMTPIPLCSIAEQRKINEKLDEKFSLMDTCLQEINMNLNKADLLRQSILKKAFSGQLISQDSEDESTSELLKKIAIEKEEIAEKEIADKAVARKKKSTAKKTVKS
ncbi:restriction endonuclease subunit S [Vibrio parahaemolyticus]|uniref:restriction endonuclease subunit S n=1 Tax=Vibrio parahaemolyticus TaxID=670 RepID=UPI002360A93E|nr:restriction endonuclease subunit S [Vibrio parahaemolyticus]